MSTKYYAKKDAFGFPLPSVLIAEENVEDLELVVEVNTEPLVLSQNEEQLVHPFGFKFYIRKDEDGQIIGNTFTASIHEVSESNAVEIKILKK